MAARPVSPLDDFWGAYADAGRPGPLFALRRPVGLVRALRAVRRLPREPVRPSATPGGLAVREALEVRVALGLPGRVLGTAALPVPERAEDYLVGRRAATMRRKVRAAQRAGTVVEVVDDLEEKHRLLALADRHEREHPDATYRVEVPDNADLLEHELWLVARDPTGEPLLLSVTPVDGRFATLRYFRTLGWGPAYSDARYLATAVLVDHLSRAGVRWLLDTESISAQTSGLRHFQKLVGFEYVRFVLARR